MDSFSKTRCLITEKQCLDSSRLDCLMAIKGRYWIAFNSVFLIAIVAKHLHGVSFVSKLFLSVVSHIIVLFDSFISHPLLGIICC